jgi:hypothetical protein
MLRLSRVARTMWCNILAVTRTDRRFILQSNLAIYASLDAVLKNAGRMSKSVYL